MEKIPQDSWMRAYLENGRLKSKKEPPRQFMTIPILSESEMPDLAEAKRRHRNELQRQRYYRKRIAYIEGCVCKCGKPKLSGESICQDCMAEKEKATESRKQKQQEYLKRYERQRSLQKMQQPQKCYFCGEPTVTTEYRICPECRQKWEAEHTGQAALGAAGKDVD